MFTKIIANTFVASSQTLYFFLEIVDLFSLWRSSISRMEVKAAGDLLTTSPRGSLSRARFARVLVYFRLRISACLYGPLYEQPVGCSGKVPSDLLHRHPEPNI